MTASSRSDLDFDPELMAYADGQLGPEAAAIVEARIAEDPEAQATIEAWATQRAEIRALATALDTGPASLRTAALERELAKALQRQGWRARVAPPQLRRLAASVALVALGWSGHWAYSLATGSAAYPGYVAEGIGAHQVFAHDREYPVEFAAADTGAAMGWISAKLERTLAHPALEPLGLELVGTRMLGTREGPLAQFIYEDDNGNRLSLIVAPHPEGRRTAPLRYAGEGDQRVGYWSDTRLDYALVGRAGDLDIREVAAEVAKLMR